MMDVTKSNYLIVAYSKTTFFDILEPGDYRSNMGILLNIQCCLQHFYNISIVPCNLLSHLNHYSKSEKLDWLDWL